MVDLIHTKNRDSHRSKNFRWLILLAGMAAELLFLGKTELQAQRSPFDPVWTSEAAQIREEVTCFTDRSLYIGGELIQFKAMVSLSGPGDTGLWSTVLYVELVSEDGRALTRGKYPIFNSMSSGEIRIPPALLSGNYYLRCYTRWLRNRGPELFCYLPLGIINPNRSDLVLATSTEKTQALVPVSAQMEHSLEFREHISSYERGGQYFAGATFIRGTNPGISGRLPFSSAGWRSAFLQPLHC